MAFLCHNRISVTVLAGLTIIAPGMGAKSKPGRITPPGAKDEIQVAGHIQAPNGPVLRFFTTQHHRSYYLYAEHDGGKGVTLIDVTDAGKPSILANVPYSAGDTESLAVAVGTAALVTTGPAAPTTAPAAQTIQIMDFSDPSHLQVAREFTGVTAMSRDDRRGLIFVANGDGIWILRQHLAEDPEMEKAYANQVLYSH